MSHTHFNIDAAIEFMLRVEMERRLRQCTKHQQEIFIKMFSEYVPAKKLRFAINLIDRTISKNERKKRQKGT